MIPPRVRQQREATLKRAATHGLSGPALAARRRRDLGMVDDRIVQLVPDTAAKRG